jgi:hypothetical protein
MPQGAPETPATLEAAEHFPQRRLAMIEPFWGGSLGATCEDKEALQAALQAFVAVYEMTKEPPGAPLPSSGATGPPRAGVRMREAWGVRSRDRGGAPELARWVLRGR